MINQKKKICVRLVSIIVLLTMNEFTLVYFDEAPPLSGDALYEIRVFDLLILVFGIFGHKLLDLRSAFHTSRAFAFYFHKLRDLAGYFTLYVILFACFDLALGAFGFGYASHFEEQNLQRYPHPYDMFRGKPLSRDHNEFGFRGPNPDPSGKGDQFRVAFFSGSTGYYGKPPILDRVVSLLADMGIKVEGFNFSSVSSNHNQHLHRLIEFADYKFDLIIFYGGGNESFQHYIYDPRPGYPYNFFVRNELDPLRYFLIRYSAIFGELDKITGLISGLARLRHDRDSNFESWLKAIEDNYARVHEIARRVSERSIAPAVCSTTRYLPVLQPMNPTSPELSTIFDRFSEKARTSVEGILDLTYLSNRLAFSDILHVDNQSKQTIAEELAPFVRDLLIRTYLKIH